MSVRGGIESGGSANWKASPILQCTVDTAFKVWFQPETPVCDFRIYNATSTLLGGGGSRSQVGFSGLSEAFDYRL